MSRLSLAILLTLTGCASSGHTITTGQTPASTRVSSAGANYDINSVTESRTSSHWIEKAPEQVWRVLPDVYEGLGIEAGLINAESHIYGARGVRTGSRIGGQRISDYLDCGITPAGQPAADLYSVRLTAMTALKSVAEGTQIHTQVVGEARPRATAGNAVRCTTTGDLELRIANLLGFEKTGS